MAKIEIPTNQIQNLAGTIVKNPVGILVIVLCIAVFYLFRDNKDLRQELRQARDEHIRTLREINSELKQLEDSTKILLK